MALPILPFWGLKNAIGHHDSKLSYWELVHAQPDRPTPRLRFSYGGDHLGRGRIAEQEAFERTGHYRFEEGRLYTRYDDQNNNETSVAIRFECAELLVDAPKPFQMHYEQGRASPPLVGRWVKARHQKTGPDVWDFRPDGTFREERLEKNVSGSYKKAKGGVDISWNSPASGESLWKIRKANGSLFITRDGRTTEFKRRAPF